MQAKTRNTSERKLQAKILKRLRSLEHGKFFKIIVANERGVPDIIGCFKGQFVAFEIKRPGEELKQIQWVQANEIMLAGGHFFRIESPDQITEVLKQI
jgi:hypothetical protein